MDLPVEAPHLIPCLTSLSPLANTHYTLAEVSHFIVVTTHAGPLAMRLLSHVPAGTQV